MTKRESINQSAKKRLASTDGYHRSRLVLYPNEWIHEVATTIQNDGSLPKKSITKITKKNYDFLFELQMLFEFEMLFGSSPMDKK